MLGLLDKARAVLNFLLESLFLLGRTARSILGTSRNLITGRSDSESPADQMEIIHGYWDPRNLCFIEWESETDQVELCTLPEAGPARRPCRVSGASAAEPGNGGASDKTKTH